MTTINLTLNLRDVAFLKQALAGRIDELRSKLIDLELQYPRSNEDWKYLVADNLARNEVLLATVSQQLTEQTVNKEV